MVSNANRFLARSTDGSYLGSFPTAELARAAVLRAQAEIHEAKAASLRAEADRFDRLQETTP
ncbi:hypothetical protein AWB91_09085 [Mycobacterium paraense]|uniref:DUF2188 domain-containing protein n=1 Tax=Mycobacterium paraense TaxID=767916 RepID=A0ABX3VUC5_9MYCO|nr:hypothetical protein AWB91_09085 [Mycobacterium paraense]ORW34669.1 hypothetical protein AWB88_02690 [Mycobacterium paraense]